MLTPDTNEAVYGPGDNQGDALFPVNRGNRLVPLDPNIATNMDPNEMKIAFGGAGAKAANFLGRILFPTSKHNTLGGAYSKLQQKTERAEAARLGGKIPTEEAVDLLKPKQPGQVIEPRPRFDSSARPPDVSPTVTQGQPTTPTTPPPQTTVPQTGIVAESNATDGYKKWLTLGDDDLDRMMKGSTEDPRIVDGMIAGLRVRSAEGAQVPPGAEVKVPDEGHIYSILSSTGDVIKDKLKGKSPDELKVISQEQTRQMADLLGTNEEKLKDSFFGGYFKLGPKNPGELAARMVAGKNLLVSEIRKLDELADVAAEQGSDKARWEWRRQAELVANLQRNLKGAQTDIARALSAMRIPTDGNPVNLRRDYAKMLDDMGGSDSIAEMIDGYRNLPDMPSRLNHVNKATLAQKLMDAAHEVWLNSLLSGWFTHVKNTAGVVAANLMEISELTLTATRQLPYPMMGKVRDVQFGDIGAKIFGQTMAMQEAFIAGGRAFWLREEAFKDATMKEVTGGGNPVKRADAFSAEAFGTRSGNWSKFVDMMGHGTTLGRGPMRALMAEDSFGKMVMFKGSLYEQAYVAARQKGLKGEELSEAIAEFVFNPPREAREIALDTAKYNLLQSEMEGSLKKLGSVLGGNRFLRMLVPFYKTPTNGLLWVADRTPFAKFSFYTRYQNAKAAGGRQLAIANSRIMMGTGLMFLLYNQWEAGDFTGGLTRDPKLRRAYERQGIRPYHARFNGTYYNYGMVEPLSTIIGLVTDAMEIIHHPDTDEKDRDHVSLAVASVLGYNLTNKTFMTGISAFMDATRNPGRYGEKFIKNYLRTAIPGSAALREIRRALDETQRMRTTLREEFMERLPGLSKTLPPRLDLWGRVMPVASRWMTPYEPNPVDQELVRLGLGLAAHPDDVMGEELTPKEKHWYHKRAGTLAFENLQTLIASDLYQKLKAGSIKGVKIASDTARNQIRKRVNDARKVAAAELVLSSPYSEGLKELFELRQEELRQTMKELKEVVR